MKPAPAKTTLTPKLRFPEFQKTEGWEACPLEELAEFVGDRVSVSELNRADYVSTENLLPDFGGFSLPSSFPVGGSVVRYRANDILAANIRPYLKKIWLADRNGGASNDVIVIRAQSSIDHQYLSHVLKNDRFIAYVMSGAKGLKMPRGDVSLIREYPVPTPSPPEQHKIASCLSSLDDLIAAERQKLDALKAHKQGLMQQLFPREGETSPRLRYPEFQDTGEWELKRLGEFAEVAASGDLDSEQFSPSKTESCCYPVYSNAVENEGIYGYYAVPKYPANCVTITARGTLGVAFLRRSEFMGIGRLLVLNFNQGIDSRFMKDCWNHLAKIPQEVTSIPQLTAVTARGTVFPIPSPKEQQRIADCLTSIDDLIAAQSAKLESLKTHKKGLMQQLFPSPENCVGHEHFEE
jgi:type I restriction enzyme S subunit